MKYNRVIKGRFLSRPNRFIAYVEADGKEVCCHVKNTGRCKELLLPGAEVYLAVSDNPNRKTACDLIAVCKGNMLVNMDSQAPNLVFGEWAKEHISGLTAFKREVTHGDSRFDFYYEAEGKGTFVEVKGVTLEENGVVRFPDAPTERGVKHLKGLTRCIREGFGAEVVFIVQMPEAAYFTPNRETHAAFADALREAKASGVVVRAFTCHVLPDEITIKQEIETRI